MGNQHHKGLHEYHRGSSTYRSPAREPPPGSDALHGQVLEILYGGIQLVKLRQGFIIIQHINLNYKGPSLFCIAVLG